MNYNEILAELDHIEHGGSVDFLDDMKSMYTEGFMRQLSYWADSQWAQKKTPEEVYAKLAIFMQAQAEKVKAEGLF